MKKIFTYTDHLKLLKDHHTSLLKKKLTYLSHRYISKKLGCKSPVVYSRILKGKMRIKDSYIQTFIDIFKIKRKDAEYFTILVHLNQSKSVVEKILAVNILLQFLQDNPELFTQTQQQTCINRFYIPIQKLLSILSVNGYYCKLKNYLIVPSDAIEIKQKDSSQKKTIPGKKENDKAIMTIPPMSVSYKVEAIRKHYMKNLELAENAILEDEDNEFNLFSFAIKTSDKKYREIEDEIIKCLEKTIKIINKDEKNGKEYLISFQSFPLTKSLPLIKHALKKQTRQEL